MIINERLYDILKFAGRILIPGVAVLYAALAAIWGWPYAEAVTATSAAICVFLNSILEYVSQKYHAAYDFDFPDEFDEEEVSE